MPVAGSTEAVQVLKYGVQRSIASGNAMRILSAREAGAGVWTFEWANAYGAAKWRAEGSQRQARQRAASGKAIDFLAPQMGRAEGFMGQISAPLAGRGLVGRVTSGSRNRLYAGDRFAD